MMVFLLVQNMCKYIDRSSVYISFAILSRAYVDVLHAYDHLRVFKMSVPSCCALMAHNRQTNELKKKT